MALDALKVDLTVVLGKTRLPLGRLLRMGRGAIIALEGDADMVQILANGVPVANGRVVVDGGRLTVEVTELVRKPEVSRTPGLTISGRVKPLPASPEAEAA